MNRPDPDGLISGILAEFRATSWEGEVWRHTFGANSPERTNLRGARWNPPGVEALYVSVNRATAIAEGDHLIESQPLRPIANRVVHRLRVSMSAVVDLTSPTALGRLGVSSEDLLGDDLRKCQAVGAAAAFLRLDGLIVPSARHPGDNLVILFTATDSAPTIEVLSSQDLEADSPSGTGT